MDLSLCHLTHFLWYSSWSFFVTEAACCSPAGFVLLGPDHILCNEYATTLLILLSHSEWYVEYFSFSAHLFLSFQKSLLAWHHLQRLSQLHQNLVPLWFSPPNVVINTDTTLNHWAFTWFPFSWGGMWWGSLYKVYIPLQEPQTVALMLCIMAFCLFCKLVALHYDNSTAKAYLCNQEGTASTFLSRIACHILNMVTMHGFYLLPAYLPNHLHVKADYLLQGRLVL